MSGKELVEKAEIISAVRDYENRRTNRKERMVDFTVSSSESDDRILVRVIKKGRSKSGYVTMEGAKAMIDTLEEENYDTGIIIGKRFTKAAKREMEREEIEMVSEEIKPHFKLNRLYSVINSQVQGLCRSKCGHVPVKESDCQGHIDGHYSCNIRLISDNASFHFDLGWADFLERDLGKLIEIDKTLND